MDNRELKDQILREFVSPDGKERILIVRRKDGCFAFEVEQWSDDPYELCWLPHTPGVSFCDTEETAVREALSRVAWGPEHGIEKSDEDNPSAPTFKL